MSADIKELMAKVGRIRILTNRLIDDQLSGDYHSSFKGQGVEFDEVRPYTPGDDVRTIDWNVTARTGMPFIKRFSEERELTILFLVDVSGSQSYGSQRRSKMELAAEVTALLALTAIRNQDKIGLVLFSDKIVKYIPPREGRDERPRGVPERGVPRGAVGGGRGRPDRARARVRAVRARAPRGDGGARDPARDDEGRGGDVDAERGVRAEVRERGLGARGGIGEGDVRERDGLLDAGGRDGGG